MVEKRKGRFVAGIDDGYGNRRLIKSDTRLITSHVLKDYKGQEFLKTKISVKGKFYLIISLEGKYIVPPTFEVVSELDIAYHRMNVNSGDYDESTSPVALLKSTIGYKFSTQLPFSDSVDADGQRH